MMTYADDTDQGLYGKRTTLLLTPSSPQTVQWTGGYFDARSM